MRLRPIAVAAATALTLLVSGCGSDTESFTGAVLDQPYRVEKCLGVVRLGGVGGEQAQQLDRGGGGVAADALLQHHADLGTQGGAVAGGVQAEHAHQAGVGVPEAFADLDRGRLAGPVRAEQCEHRAPGSGQAESVDRSPLSVRLDEVTNLDGIPRVSGHENSLESLVPRPATALSKGELEDQNQKTKVTKGR